MMSRLWKSLLSLFVLLTVLPFQPAAAAVTGFKQVEAGANFSLALKGDGTVWTWGTMSSSQNFSLTHVDGLSNITDIAAGFQHALALQADGTVWAWGENKFGELGDGSETARSLPVKVVGPGGSGSLENVKALAAGNNFSLVLKQDGTIWAWGNNTWGQLGDGTTDKKSTPVQATGLTEMTAIAAGYEHAVALKQDGTVWTMGKNDMGQLGDGTTFGGVPIRQVKDPADPSKPFTGVKAIAAGTNHSIALKNDGTVWVWGANDFGQLGDGTNGGQVLLPKQVLVPDGVVDVPLQATKLVESFNNTFVIKNDKSLWGWGYNSYGQLGTGTEGDRSSPSQVVGPGGAGFLNGVIDVSGGDEHTVALKEDGSIWTWGSNAQSQLG
ncbi:MAG: RCC1 domain-containing protein, partial [Clostridia bacterium]